MRPYTSALAALLLLGAAGASRAKDAPLFIELPPNALASDVGANGFVVLGNIYGGGVFHWMPTAGVEAIGGWEGTAISRDGRTIVGDAFDSNGKENAAIWQGGQDWRLLGSFTPDAQPCDLLLSGAFGASDDGKVIVGLGWDGCRHARAFRWEESTGMVDLGSTVSGRSSRANDVSGDGRVVVGWQEREDGLRLGAKWVNGVQELFRGPFGDVGEARAANRDGSFIVGSHCSFLGIVATAWTWTPAGGVTCFPVEKPPWLVDRPYSALMLTTSDDGRVIGGSFSFGLDAEALIWLDGQVYFLRDYLRDNGVPGAFRDWVNSGFVLGVSSDGRTLVGYGAGPRTFQGYMVVLPERE